MDTSLCFICQLCRAKIVLAGNLDERPSTSASVFGESGKIDESFIVLDDKRQPGQAGAVAPGQRNMEESFIVLGSATGGRGPPGSSPALASGLPQASSSQPSSQQQQQQQPSAPSTPPSDAPSFGLDAKLCALAQLFEMASTQTHVDHPLCLDCAAQLKDEIEAQIQDAEREIAAYSTAVARLEKEALEALPDDVFQAEMEALKQQEAEDRRQAEAYERELAEVNKELEKLRSASCSIDTLEERYWHDYNDYQLQLQQHIEERDALLNKIDRTSQRLQLLKNTNVYNDAFKIWHDGPFGTISGFRLGRTPEVPVEWDEINAAWGQAVLLLHTMAQACALNFSACRLLPMGSHPRVITDKRTTYDLFGPVNKLWSANYDRAMSCYLSCLREFGEFAKAKDVAEGKSPTFLFPFPIEGDKVNNHTIKLTLNKDAKWTKALKFMLADLKVALQWMVKYELSAGAVQLTALGPEGPASLQPV